MLRNEEESGWGAAEILRVSVCVHVLQERERERERERESLKQSYVYYQLNKDKLQGVGLSTN